MINRKYVIQQLSNIQGEVDKVMLMEGPLFTKFCGGVVKLFTRSSTKVEAIKAANASPQVIKLAEELVEINKLKRTTGAVGTAGVGIISTITAWFWGKSSGKAEAAADNAAYKEATGRDPDVDAAVYNGTQAMPKNLPDSKALLSSIPNNQAANEDQRNAFAKMWDSVVNNYNKVCDTIRDGIKFIGGTPFLVLGYGTALGLMMAGALAYYINVGGEIGASLKRVFSDTFNGIKNATGVEQIMRVMLSPILLVMKFIEESPIGTLLFMLGIFVFLIISAGTLIGWDVIFGDGKDKAEGKKPLAAPAQGNPSGDKAGASAPTQAASQQTASGTTDVATGTTSVATGTPNVATGTPNAGQPRSSYLEPIW